MERRSFYRGGFFKTGEAVDHFNNFFASKCTPLQNKSVLSILLERESEARFPSITFTDDQILKTLWALDINKAHGYNEIPIRMLKLCGKSIITPQSTLSQNSKDFPRHLEEVKYCACSQNRRQADS